MQDNKNTSFGCSQSLNNGTVCIDTLRVLDSCRDRDCFEDTRVYLSAVGNSVLQNSTNLRTKSAKILCAYVGVEEIPFNNGFYQVVIRYYIKVELEACVGGRSQTLYGLSAVEKDVILYGGEGRAMTFASGEGSFCGGCCIGCGSTNDPVAITETVEPVVLGTKVNDCNCSCVCTDYVDFPESVLELFGEDVVTNNTAPTVYVSFGIFSVIRMVRPAQLLINATDYSVPDKECTPSTNNDNPCALFRTMPFPTSQFGGYDCGREVKPQKNGGCGCK